MRLKKWALSLVRDDKKHAELDVREARTDERVNGLREERNKNGFGKMFGDAGLGTPPSGRMYGRS